MAKLFKDDELARSESKTNDNLAKLENAAANLNTWDLEGHKLMYTEAIDARKRALQKLQKVDLPYRAENNAVGPP